MGPSPGITGVLAHDLPELLLRDLVDAQVERRVISTSCWSSPFVLRPFSVLGEPIWNVPAGISTSFMPMLLVISLARFSDGSLPGRSPSDRGGGADKRSSTGELPGRGGEHGQRPSSRNRQR